MNVKGTVFMALLCAAILPPPASAQEFRTIFNGTVGEQRVVAVSVRGAYAVGELIDALRPYATPRTTLIAYINHDAASEVEPVVVYVDGENVHFAETPLFSTASPTFAEVVDSAKVVSRGERNGAICRDGTRTDRTNNGACSFNGGRERWQYEAVTRSDPRQVVATICTDYRMVSGGGERCGDAEALVAVYDRPYADHAAAEPASEEPVVEEVVPTERPVAPLPEPALAVPTVNDSRVDWTVRENGVVGFAWAALLANANAQPVRALVTVSLRDADDEVIHSEERAVALGAGEQQEFGEEGTVGEDIALRGERWTFAVALVPHDAPLAAEELTSVLLVIAPTVEEARITNNGSEELDLNGWTLLSSVGGESFTFRFFKLGPGKTVTLTSGEGARSRLPEIYLWTASEVWADAGDVAELRDARGRLRARTHPDGSAASLDTAGGKRAGRR